MPTPCEHHRDWNISKKVFERLLHLLRRLWLHWREKFLLHSVSFAALGDDEVRSRYLCCKHYDCTSKPNDTRERCWNNIKIVKIAVEVQHTTISLLFDAGIEFRSVLNTQFSSFSLQRAIIVIISLCATSTELKLQEQKSFQRNRF